MQSVSAVFLLPKKIVVCLSPKASVFLPKSSLISPHTIKLRPLKDLEKFLRPRNIAFLKKYFFKISPVFSDVPPVFRDIFCRKSCVFLCFDLLEGAKSFNSLTFIVFRDIIHARKREIQIVKGGSVG